MADEETEKQETKEEPEQKSDTWFRVHGEEQTEEEFCAWVQTQIREHPVVRIHHGQWKLNEEWRQGNQFTKLGDAREVVPVSLVTRKRQVVINLIKPLLETIEGKVNFYQRNAG